MMVSISVMAGAVLFRPPNKQPQHFVGAESNAKQGGYQSTASSLIPEIGCDSRRLFGISPESITPNRIESEVVW